MLKRLRLTHVTQSALLLLTLPLLQHSLLQPVLLLPHHSAHH
jgi:hypothetical protein